jgi:hypothetical protein
MAEAEKTAKNTARGSGGERAGWGVVLIAALAFNVWGVTLNWSSTDLPGNGFRQTQTAITALFVQRENDFGLAYPTPVLGRPWSAPFEFPLYQWTVVVVSNATGWPLIQAGRAVSAACFYLTLPAVWLLAGQCGLARVRRPVVLAAVLMCPLYVFYARAFLIETMALMFAVWFLQAFVAAMRMRSAGWLMVANVAGVGAGLVKITTFMVYLVPAGVGASVWLWRSWREERWAGVARSSARIAAMCAVPCAASLAWLEFADAVKARNPGARNLVSSTMHGYNFGTWEARVSPDLWSAHGQIVTTHVVTVAGVVAALVVAWAAGRRGARWLAAGAGLSAVAVATFPILYAWHEYYWVANALPAVAAVGVAAGLAMEGSRWRARAAMAGLAVFLATQAWCFWREIYPKYWRVEVTGAEFARVLKEITRPDDVLIIAGEDWGSMTPFYAGRRALMIRRAMDRDVPYLEESLENLRGERVAAFLATGAMREQTELRERVRGYFDIGERPDFSWGETDVYLNGPARTAALARLAAGEFAGIEVRGGLPGDGLLGREVRFEELGEELRGTFAEVSPRPARVMARFGFERYFEDGRWWLNAHPDFQMWFGVPAGERTIRMEYRVRDGAYAEVSETDESDGVELAVYERTRDGEYRRIFSRVLDPVRAEGDRGLQRVELKTRVADGSIVLIETHPIRHYRRDWIALSGVTIE